MMEQVHIWLGNFESEKRLYRYMEERKDYYSEENEDNDNIALNEFIADQNENYFDHDWVESFYNPRRTTKSLLSNCSYSENFARAAATKAAELNLADLNAVIMLDAGEVRKPVSAQGDGYDLAYIGKFAAHTVNDSPPKFDKYHLNLGCQNLTSIPDYVFEQTELESLSLVGNQLKELPEDLFKLANLEILMISNNQLTTLPKYFSRLEKLEVIQAGNNLIEEIHEDIVSLKYLHRINLTKNKLKAIPNNIGKLVSLECLNLKENQIEKLPDSIMHLENLRQLTLTGNPIKQLPASNGFFENIPYFSIDDDLNA